MTSIFQVRRQNPSLEARALPFQNMAQKWSAEFRYAMLAYVSADLCLPLSAKHFEGISAGFGKSTVKHSKNYRIISYNQKVTRALTSTPKAIARINTLCCLATSGTKTAGSVTSQRSDVVINWHLSPPPPTGQAL